MSEWIDANLLLPKEGQKVAFIVKFRSEPFGGCFKDGKFREGLDNWYFENEKITHWMPLPKKPEKMERYIFLCGYGEITLDLYKEIAKKAFDLANEKGLIGMKLSAFKVDYMYISKSSDPLDKTKWYASFQVNIVDETKPPEVT